MNYVPAYQQITEWLRSVIEKRGDGAILPTISEIQDRFNVGGVQTVRDAYNILIEEGLVVRKDSPRRYFVVDPTTTDGSNTDNTALLTELKNVLRQATVLVEELEHAV